MESLSMDHVNAIAVTDSEDVFLCWLSYLAYLVFLVDEEAEIREAFLVSPKLARIGWKLDAFEHAVRRRCW